MKLFIRRKREEVQWIFHERPLLSNGHFVLSPRCYLWGGLTVYWPSCRQRTGFAQNYPQYVAVVVRVHFARFSNARKWKDEESLLFVLLAPSKIQRKWPVKRLMWSIQVPRRPNSSNCEQIMNYFFKLLKVGLLFYEGRRPSHSFASFSSIKMHLTVNFSIFPLLEPTQIYRFLRTRNAVAVGSVFLYLILC